MRIITCAAALSALLAIPTVAHAEGASLAAARELYASAAYDDALAMLDGLAEGTTVPERQSVDLYRTLCLVALGRTSDADRAIETMIQRDPLYRASADELSPRLRSAFADTRKRMLPSIIQKMYADSKAAFDKQDFVAAAAGFGDVLKAVGDPDMAAQAGAPPLSDLRTLASGFLDLSAKFTAPPPEPTPEPKVVRPARSVYSAADADVTPPITVVQKVPKYPGSVLKPSVGVVEFIVDENGLVQSPIMRAPIDRTYDQIVISAVKKWQYRPATLDDMPVKFLKRLSISVMPTPPPQ